MPCSQFTTIGKVKEAFNLAVVAGIRFLPEIEPIAPATALQTVLEINLPWAIAASRYLDISHLRQHFQRHRSIALHILFVKKERSHLKLSTNLIPLPEIPHACIYPRNVLDVGGGCQPQI